jgi:nodulation protein E
MNSPSPRQVVITGMGVISALGPTLTDFWAALRVGRSGIGPIQAPGCQGLAFTQGAEVQGFDPLLHFDPKALKHLDRFSQFGLVAAREAVQQAGIEWPSDLMRQRTGVVTGNSLGGQITLDQAASDLYGEQRNRCSPLTIPRSMPNAGASTLSLAYGITGPVFTLSSGCASSTHAMGQAFWMVRQGLLDRALVGGSEAPFCRSHLKAWEALRNVSADTCRPFCRDRSGLILGEGGAILVMETLEAAQERGAPILGEVVGFGMSSNATHLTQPSATGAAQAMRAALDDAALPPEAIGYINAHGTGTLTNDPVEAQAIHSVFGVEAVRLPMSSTKSMHGHVIGAAGALEAVATLLALHHRYLPATANFTEPDLACDLEVLPNEGREADVEYAMSNSFSLGGLNGVLIFRRGPSEGKSWTLEDSG